MGNIIRRNTDPERAQSRRTQVLDAAAVCFSRSGFHGASMSEISKQAGMSAGHIYNYFDNKDAIIMAFVCIRMEHVRNHLGLIETADDPLDYMFQEIGTIVEQHLDPEFWGVSLEIFAEASRNPTIAAALQEADASARAQLRPQLVRGRARRGLATDDATIDGRIEAIIALYNGLALRSLHNPGLDRRAVATAFEVAMRALLMS